MLILEVNERKIIRQKIWLNGVDSFANILAIDGFSGYNFIDNPGQIHYNMIAYDSTTDERTRILSGVLPLTMAVIANWGADDQIIFDYVATELGLTFN